MELSDLPDAALLDILVLVDAVAPGGALAQLPFHDYGTPTGFGRQPVAGNVHDGLDLDVVVELAVLQAGAAPSQCEEVLTNPLPAGIDPVEGDLHGRIRGEQIRHFVPHRLIEVIAVSPLQPFHRFRILDAIGFGLEPCKLRPEFGGFFHSGAHAGFFGFTGEHWNENEEGRSREEADASHGPTPGSLSAFGILIRPLLPHDLPPRVRSVQVFCPAKPPPWDAGRIPNRSPRLCRIYSDMRMIGQFEP